jgi:hypothetical protein
MAEIKIRITTAAFYRLMTLITLGLILAACNPLVISQETKEADTQTKEITLEPSLEITQTATLNKLQEAIKEASTQQAAYTPTPSNTPTPEDTPTPEPTPTPTAVEIPDDIDWTGDLVVKENLIHPGVFGPYDPIQIPIKIRPQDVHKDEPFTLFNGKYHVQVWADAWFREGFQEEPFGPIEEGPIYHITVPIVVYDLEEDQSWIMQVPVISKYAESPRIEMKRQSFTGPFEENFLAEDMDDILCFAADGNRDCGTMDNYDITLGATPQEFPNNYLFQLNIQDNIEFWQELMESVYTDENIAEFEKTLDINLFTLDSEPNVPADFILPLRADS